MESFQKQMVEKSSLLRHKERVEKKDNKKVVLTLI